MPFASAKSLVLQATASGQGVGCKSLFSMKVHGTWERFLIVSDWGLSFSFSLSLTQLSEISENWERGLSYWICLTSSGSGTTPLLGCSYAETLTYLSWPLIWGCRPVPFELPWSNCACCCSSCWFGYGRYRLISSIDRYSSTWISSDLLRSFYMIMNVKLRRHSL